MTTLQAPGINVSIQRRQTTAQRLRQEGEAAIHAAGDREDG
jgi:hypothetical protein